MAAPRYFDAHLHADGLSDQDLRSLAWFGVRGALLAAHDVVPAVAKDLVGHLEELAGVHVQRLLSAGIRPFLSLGIHPARAPWHGVEEVLASVPGLARAGRLVAIGEIGLEQGSALEEKVFERQLELAQELHLPVLVHTPEKEKQRLTRRALAILKASGLPASSVLVDHADATTLKGIREWGFHAGLTVNPSRLTPENVAALISEFGCEGLVVSSDAGDGIWDLFSLPRTAAKLEAERLSPQIIRRALCENALAFLRLPREALEAPAQIRRLRP